MANFTRIGFGQVEPNQLSGIKTGQIYASLPLAKDVNILQNGEFMYYDYASSTVTGNTEVEGFEPFLVYQEIKLYDPSLTYKDFAMVRVGENYVTHRPVMGFNPFLNEDGTYSADSYGEGSTNTVDSSRLPGGSEANPPHTEYGYRMDGIAPRLIKTNVGDIFTTNMVKTGDEYEKGDILTLEKTTRNTLMLQKSGSIDVVQFVVAKVYTMPDGQPGLKLQRVK